MPIVENKKLYNKIKETANLIYKKPSAYKSGWIVKTYKKMGGNYIDDNQPKNLKRWFQEKWSDVGNDEYPVYRPLIRISEKTPLTLDEIDPINLKKQIELKQKIKGNYNLPPFKIKELLEIPNINKSNEIWKWSNPIEVRKLANEYLGKNIPIYISNRKNKKYMVQDPKGKWVHFGQLGYQDFTHHKNLIRKNRYLIRSTNIKGNWKNNKYSSNNLSINLLWK